MNQVAQGEVIAACGRHYQVEFARQRILQCFPRAKRGLCACGDRVGVRLSGTGQGLIVSVAARSSLLYRSDGWHDKLIAANATQVIVVVATEPSFDDALVSRCLAAAEHQRLKALVVLNKIDLTARLAQARERLVPFRAAGYGIVEMCATADAGALRQRLDGEVGVLVGQSGMGKSTIINALIPDARARTREISAVLHAGKHTTTLTRLYRLAAGGAIIDSPGMQGFGLAHVPRSELASCFPEFRPHLGRCRFRDCRHDTEPGCAIRAAVMSRQIDAGRHAHYLAAARELEAAGRW